MGADFSLMAAKLWWFFRTWFLIRTCRTSSASLAQMLTVPQAFYSCWSILSQIYHFHTSTYSSSPNPEFKLPISLPGENNRCRSPVSTASLPTISGVVVDQHGGCIVGIHQGIEALALTPCDAWVRVGNRSDSTQLVYTKSFSGPIASNRTTYCNQ